MASHFPFWVKVEFRWRASSRHLVILYRFSISWFGHSFFILFYRYYFLFQFCQSTYVVSQRVFSSRTSHGFFVLFRRLVQSNEIRSIINSARVVIGKQFIFSFEIGCVLEPSKFSFLFPFHRLENVRLLHTSDIFLSPQVEKWNRPVLIVIRMSITRSRLLRYQLPPITQLVSSMALNLLVVIL